MNTFMRCAMVLAFAITACTAQALRQAISPKKNLISSLVGRVNIEGAIFSSACNINAGDGWQTVEMGSETLSHMAHAGEGEPQPFSVTLTRCSLTDANDTAPWQYLRITFDGDEEDGLFRLNGDASGMALELTDKNGRTIHPGKTMAYRQVTLKNMRLDYLIKLKTTARNLMVGDYRAILRYRVEYY